jgi:hypothetical protein
MATTSRRQLIGSGSRRLVFALLFLAFAALFFFPSLIGDW